MASHWHLRGCVSSVFPASSRTGTAGLSLLDPDAPRGLPFAQRRHHRGRIGQRGDGYVQTNIHLPCYGLHQGAPPFPAHRFRIDHRSARRVPVSSHLRSRNGIERYPNAPIIRMSNVKPFLPCAPIAQARIGPGSSTMGYLMREWKLLSIRVSPERRQAPFQRRSTAGGLLYYRPAKNERAAPGGCPFHSAGRRLVRRFLNPPSDSHHYRQPHFHRGFLCFLSESLSKSAS